MSTDSDSDSARRTAEARAAVTASLASVGGSVNNEMRQRAADLHANSNAIEKQEKELAKQTAALAKQSAQWQKLADTSTKKLNEIGDIQNWAEMIERDLLVLEETLRLVEDKAAPGSASGTNNNGWTG
jgi:tellurite resistance protein